MRTRVIAAGFALAWLWAAPAHAGWTKPQRFAAADASARAAATNGRGEAVVAWASERRISSTRRSASVRVAVRAAGGRLRTRTLWHSRHAAVPSVSATIDRRGRITVAWVHWDPAAPGPSGIVRAAYGSAGGSFTRTQVVGKAGADSSPSLAAARAGTVLMVWNERFGAHDRERDVAAWHAGGHRFGAPRRLSASSRAPSDLDGLRAAFDSRGTAYVWGPCSTSVLSAPAGSRRFGRPMVLGGRASGFSLSLDGAGRGLAGWAAGRCSTGVEDAPERGPVMASVLRSGSFATPVAISTPGTLSDGATAIDLPGGTGLVSFRSLEPLSSAYDVFTARLSGTVFGPAEPVADHLAPLSADAGGDVLLQGDESSPSSPRRIVIRPAGGGADQAAPSAPTLWPAATATAPFGRGAALVWTQADSADGGAPARRLALSIWAP